PVVNEAIADASATVAEAFTLTIPNGRFTDADGNPLTYNATLEDGSPLPSWLSFDAKTNTFTGTPSPNNRGNLSIKITASDGSLSVSDTFTLTVSEIATPPAEEPPAETPNAAPVLENAISSLNAIAFQPFSFTLPDDTFSDPDGDSLTYITTLANGSPLPEWLQFDSITGTFTGLPTQDAIGNLTIKLTASDGTASVDTELTINVLSEPAIMSGPWGPIGPPTFAAFLKQNPNSQAVALPDLTAICHGEMTYPGPNLTEITLDGSETDDNLIGGDRPETLNGFGGNDFLHGLSGNDNLFGSEGNDLIHGNRGNDYIEGGNGNDEIHAGKDDDVILGGEGEDELYGNYGNDIIMAGNGNDFANGNQGDDILKG
ncbi:MAG TPA: putative Ig domain-containing protein, partial [Vampirovibrionales bacterium]